MHFSTNKTIVLKAIEPTQPLFFAEATKEKKEKGKKAEKFVFIRI